MVILLLFLLTNADGVGGGTFVVAVFGDVAETVVEVVVLAAPFSHCAALLKTLGFLALLLFIVWVFVSFSCCRILVGVVGQV